MGLAAAVFSVEGYAVLVLATAVAGVWRAPWPVRACTALLVASWAATLVLPGDLALLDLAMAYAVMHGVVAAAIAVLLAVDGALWLALLAGVAAVQFVLHLTALSGAPEADAALRRAYNTAVALLFTAQLGCIWLARTRLGRAWPAAWRTEPPDGP